ncbi:MAG: heme biosynthesis HemY N-terminal domain-containing protein [Geobacteraceae bacterium]|nr:heme biosynthesis HemY N-terminal domain-containing protein [Geobacteraceae bacterium]
MFLKTFFLSALLFSAYLYFSFLNRGNITIFLPNGVYETTVPLLVVGAILAGALVVLLANLVGLGKTRLLHWRSGRRTRGIREAEENLRQGLATLRAGDLKRARFLLEKACEKDPFSTPVYGALAELAEQEGNTEEVLKCLGKARELDEKNLELLFRSASVYEVQGDSKNAADLYDRILLLDTSNRRAMAALRELYRRQGAWREALEMQKSYLKLTPPERQAPEIERLIFFRYECARLSLALGATEKSAAELREIISEKPSFIPAHVSLAEALKQEQKVEEATDLLKKAFQELRHPIFLIKLEDLFFSQDEPGKIAALVNFYKRRIHDNPHDLLIRLFYGKLCIRMIMAEEALIHLKVIVESGVDFPSLHILLAEAYRRTGDLDEAVSEYRKALGVGKTHRIPFVCRICGHEQIEWSSFCPACGAWDSYDIRACVALDSAKPFETYVIPV